MPDLIFKQVWAQIDERTTSVCLNAAGQVRPVSAPFNTENGDYDAPPFHVGCRSVSVPYLVGQRTQKDQAAREAARRPSRSSGSSKPPRPKPRTRIVVKRRKPSTATRRRVRRRKK